MFEIVCLEVQAALVNKPTNLMNHRVTLVIPTSDQARGIGFRGLGFPVRLTLNLKNAGLEDYHRAY